MSESGKKFVQKVKPVYVDGDGNEIPSAHMNIPFDNINLNNTDTNLADGGTMMSNFTATLWGTGLDFYPTRVSIFVGDATEFSTEENEGITVYMYYVIGADTYYCLTKTYNRQTTPVIYIGNQTKYYTMITEELYGFKVPSIRTFTCVIFNDTGVALDTVHLSILGFAV
jgi:hypothetical protein